MKAWLWQFITGYVTIKIEGLKLLQFVNDAAAQGILLRSAERESYSRITAVISWRDYNRLLALSRNRPLRVVALSQRGLPHLGALALKRMAFVIGLMLCLIALVAVNRFVLDVRVSGCTKPGLEAKVLGTLQGMGLKPGADKASVDLHECERALMRQYTEISFAAIEVNGVVAQVSVVESTAQPKLLDTTVACDVVASRDAIVRKTIVYEGQVKVTAGQAVRAGQLLVDGTVTLMEGVKRVHARADILASVWYEGEGSAPLFAERKQRTGAMVERSRLELAGFSLPVGDQGAVGIENFETETIVQYLLGEGLKGPRLVTTRYWEVQPLAGETDFEAARQKAFLDAESQTREAIPVGVKELDSRTDYSFADGNIIVKVYVETLENIAVEQPK